jgi:hypothetical protein
MKHLRAGRRSIMIASCNPGSLCCLYKSTARGKGAPSAHSHRLPYSHKLSPALSPTRHEVLRCSCPRPPGCVRAISQPGPRDTVARRWSRSCPPRTGTADECAAHGTWPQPARTSCSSSQGREQDCAWYVPRGRHTHTVSSAFGHQHTTLASPRPRLRRESNFAVCLNSSLADDE